MSNNYNEKLIVKYGVKTIDDMQLPTRIMDLVNAKSESVYRFLFYSTPGTGKTTLAKMLTKGMNILYLSGSNDFDVNTMRTKVYPFCQKHSIDNKPKVCIIDECDNINKKIQESFKILTDSTIKSVRFIFITNNIDKIDTAVFSRFTKINFNFTANELTEQQGNYVKFAVDICKAENIGFDKDGMMEMYKKFFPDFRQMIDTLENFKLTNQKITASTIRQSDIVAGIQIVEIYDLIMKPKDYDPKSVYTLLSKYKNQEIDVLNSLCNPFFTYLNNLGKYSTTLEVAEIMNKYCVEYSQTMNKFALLISCINELRKIGI